MMDVFDFKAFPVLETPRLRLRQITRADAEAVFRIRSDFEVTRYNTGAPYRQLDQAIQLIENITAAYGDHSEIRWGITLKDEADELIGMIGYNYWIRADCRASVGYDLARAYWGHGLMPEALRAVVEFGFERMLLNRIEADAEGRNPASRRVLEKVGFRCEGIQREHFYADNGFHDLWLFGLLRREWADHSGQR